MKKNNKIFILLFIIVSSLFSQSETRSPSRRSADKFTYDNKGQVFQYTGNSKMEDSSAIITSHVMTFYKETEIATFSGNVRLYSKTNGSTINAGYASYDGKTKYAYARNKPILRSTTNNVTIRSSYMERDFNTPMAKAISNVHLTHIDKENDKKTDGYADELSYNMDTQVSVLKGNPRLYQGNDRIEGEILEYNSKISLKDIFKYNYGGFIIENEENIDEIYLGKIISEKYILYKKEKIDLKKLSLIYENKLEKIYSCNIKTDKKPIKNFSYETKNRIVSKIKIAKPKVIIPVFPGTNCEYESAKAFEYAGAKAKIIVINNLSSDNIKKSVDNFSKELKTSQIIFIPGGFSGGDEPDGSGKFITAFFRNHIIKEETTKLLDKRGGLILGICNGFQALIKLGLVPFGKIIETDENCPTLTFNEISRHQSKIVRTRIASNKSPWLSYMNVGDIVSVPISHGEGRFIASEDLIKKLSENGQIATQYVDFEGDASNDIRFNPNGSIYAIEGITSPNGRVFGKMGHSERIGNGLYKNVLGNYDIKMFKSAVEYFK